MTSCPNSTSPIDITNNYDSICDLKCEYSFNYPFSPLNLTNKGDHLYMTMENNNIPPVTYNASKYNVKEIRIYRPSLHTYAGKSADAELIIVHNNMSENSHLLVCVPIVVGSANTDTIALFDSLLLQMAKTANSPGKKTTLNNFTLEKMVPKKPFFSYNGTLPYSPCNENYDFIVFGKNNAISMDKKTNYMFANMIKNHTYTTQKNKNGLFFNNKGPKQMTNGDNDIYIDCQPTGASGNILVEKDIMNDSLFNKQILAKFFHSTLFYILLSVVVFLLILYVANKFLKIMTTTTKRGGGGGSVSVDAASASSSK
jgi:carbonic anhydrase